VSASAISLSLTVDGGTPITGTDSTANLRTAFDEIAFTNGFQNPNLNYLLDHVSVSSNVPEPGTALLLSIGSALACLRRRRQHPIARCCASLGGTGGSPVAFGGSPNV
jgi:hypothetical protein